MSVKNGIGRNVSPTRLLTNTRSTQNSGRKSVPPKTPTDTTPFITRNIISLQQRIYGHTNAPTDLAARTGSAQDPDRYDFSRTDDRDSDKQVAEQDLDDSRETGAMVG